MPGETKQNMPRVIINNMLGETEWEYAQSNGVEYVRRNGVEYTKGTRVEYARSNGAENPGEESAQ